MACPERLALAVGDMLRAIGVPEVEVIRELRHMVDWRIAKTASRRVLGSMNDFAWMAEVDPRETMSLLDPGAPPGRVPMQAHRDG